MYITTYSDRAFLDSSQHSTRLGGRIMLILLAAHLIRLAVLLVPYRIPISGDIQVIDRVGMGRSLAKNIPCHIIFAHHFPRVACSSSDSLSTRPVLVSMQAPLPVTIDEAPAVYPYRRPSSYPSFEPLDFFVALNSVPSAQR